MKENWRRFIGVEAFENGLVNFSLFVVEGEWLGGDKGFAGIGVASYFEVDEFDPAFLGEGFERGGGRGSAEFGDGDGFV